MKQRRPNAPLRRLSDLRPYPSSREQSRAISALPVYFPDTDFHACSREEFNAAVAAVIDAQRTERQAYWNRALGRALREEF